MNPIFVALIFYTFLCSKASGQSGCRDPQALNYDPAALENDGSCIYPPTNYSPTEITQLPPSLPEPSGLAFFNGQLWTHLDGGHEDKVYRIDTLTGQIVHTVVIAGVDNIDWEDFAEDETHLYLGDFGNNGGDRKDLRILKIQKSDLTQNALTPEIIEFSFSDQTDFSTAQNANNYDCEAFFANQDSLHLFSKNWLDFQTRHYVLPKTPGEHVAELRDSFDVQGQITSTDINEHGEILLLGYNVATANVFMWLLFDYEDGRFFSGNKRKISLGNVLNISQPEGLSFSIERDGFIASEKISIFPPKLLKFSILEWVTNPPVAVFEVPGTGFEMEVFPNPFSDKLNINFGKKHSGNLQISLLNRFGRVIKSWNLKSKKNQVTFGDLALPDGGYFLKISDGKRTQLEPVYKVGN